MSTMTSPIEPGMPDWAKAFWSQYESDSFGRLFVEIDCEQGPVSSVEGVKTMEDAWGHLFDAPMPAILEEYYPESGASYRLLRFPADVVIMDDLGGFSVHYPRTRVEDLIEASECCALLLSDLGIEAERFDPEQEPTISITCGGSYLFEGQGGDENGERAAANVLVTAQRALPALKDTAAELRASRQLMRMIAKELQASESGLVELPLLEAVKALLQQRKLAHTALTYICQQVETDPDFRYYMLGTERMAKCLKALAALSGESVEQIEKQNRLPAYQKRKRPDVILLREEREHLETVVEVLRAELRSHGLPTGPLTPAEVERLHDDDLLELQPMVDRHTWQYGNEHFIIRDDGPRHPAETTWKPISVNQVLSAIGDEYPHVLNFKGFNVLGHAIYEREGVTGTPATRLALISERYHPMLVGLELRQGCNPGMVAGARDGQIVVIVMSMKLDDEDDDALVVMPPKASDRIVSEVCEGEGCGK